MPGTIDPITLTVCDVQSLSSIPGTIDPVTLTVCDVHSLSSMPSASQTTVHVILSLSLSFIPGRGTGHRPDFLQEAP